MKHKLLKTIAAASLLSGFVAGTASATEGWYGRADLGYSFDANLDIDQSNQNIDLKHDFTEHLGMGYAFSNGFRLEGELGHRFNQFSTDTQVLDGDVHAWSAMINLFYDFNRGGKLQPYVGVGVGGARINAHGVINAGNDEFDDDDTVGAWQAMVGVALELSPHWDLDIGYRYFRAMDPKFNGFEDGVVPTRYDGDYTHQDLTVGLRYQFAVAAPPPPPPPPVVQQPPPPPPPPPVACPQGDYVVYFEWDRSNLNQAALETIDAAVAHARECNISGVTVVGHTDTSGSAQYNIGLSERRASVVRDALVARGINAGSIQTQARGETDLARATRDGVREPLNRRSTITISFQ